MPTRSVITKRKLPLFFLATAVTVALLLEGAAHLTTMVVNRFLTEPIATRGALFRGQSEWIVRLLDSARRDQLDPTLGWRYRPGYSGEGDTLNSAGMRSSREYQRTPTDSVPRIAAFGDSFVYCTEVSNDACWSSQLESGWVVEALNYGVGGYGTDQSFLRYLREGRTYRPSRVLVGFAPVNLRRVVNRNRRFLSQVEGPWLKPRFVLTDGELELLPAPASTEAELRLVLQDPERVIAFGDRDHWYEPAVYEHRLYRVSATYRIGANLWSRLRRRYFDPNRLYEDGLFRVGSEAFAIQERLMLAFADSIVASGATPTFLFLPSREDVLRSLENEPPVYEPLLKRLEATDVAIIDPLEAFASSGMPASDLFAPVGHYSRAGHGILASVLARELGLSVR